MIYGFKNYDFYVFLCAMKAIFILSPKSVTSEYSITNIKIIGNQVINELPEYMLFCSFVEISVKWEEVSYPVLDFDKLIANEAQKRHFIYWSFNLCLID